MLTVLLIAGCTTETNRTAPPGAQLPESAATSTKTAPGWSTRAISLPPAVQHVHGLVVDGSDGLLAATHTGLYRIGARGEVTPVGVARDDFMGLARMSDGTLLASGHPGPSSRLADPLGLIVSQDGGRTWKPRSLQGQADFHALSGRGKNIVGLTSNRVLTSKDEGRTWAAKGQSRSWTLSIDSRTIWAAGQNGLQRSDDDGRTFVHVPGTPRLALATAALDTTPWGIDLDGVVWVRPTDRWIKAASVGSADAIAAADAGTAYVVHDDTLIILSQTNQT